MKLNSPPQKFRRAALAFALLALGAGIVFWRSETPLSSAKKNILAVPPVASSPPVAPAVAATNAGFAPAIQSATLPKHPFAVVTQTGHYAWTTNDGRQLPVIRELAHNELEYQRMLEENNTIFRRQLVYQKTPFSLAAQKAVHFGEPISQLTLPNLDGQELTVEISKTEIEAGGDRGVLTGRLAGRDDSLVSIAFIGGREGFTVVSPADQIYLYAEPREPGELIVKKFDPLTYAGVLGGCGVN